MTRRQRQGRNAAEHRHARDRLLGIYAGANDTALEAGRGWYELALQGAAELACPAANVDVPRAAAIIAALSPQTKWRENVASARLVIEAVREGRAPVGARGYRRNIRKAYSIAAGAPYGVGPGDGFGGEAPKVRSFFANIVGDVDAVTLDVWAMRAATGRDGIVPSGDRYRRGVDWYRAAAEIAGEAPRDFQVIVWTATRGLSAHWRDVWQGRQMELAI